MKQSIQHKLENLEERFQEITGLLSEPEIIADQNQFRALSQEYGQLDPVVKTFAAWGETRDELEATAEMLKESDPELREMATEERKICLLYTSDAADE